MADPTNPTASPQARKKMGKMANALIMLISLALIFVFNTGFIFFTVGMLPSIIAFYLDRSHARSKFHTVFACNLSGILPSMLDMLEHGRKSSYTTELMSDIGNWMVIFGSAGLGYLLVYTSPIFAQFLISMFHQGQIHRYQSMQEKLVKEWGPEVTQFFSEKREDELFR